MILKWLKKYYAVVKVTWIQTLEYRANALVGIFAIFSGLLIEYLLWKRIFLTRNVEIINGFTFEQLIVYLFFALMVGQLKSSWVNSFEMIESIRLGELNKYLIRPISFFYYNLSLFIGYNSLYFICYGSMSIIFPFLFPGLSFQTLHSIFGFIVFLILSIFISYGIYFIMICTAFWFGEARALILAYNLANVVLSGQLIPLKMFPDKIKNIIEMTPIPYLVDIPVSCALGYIEPSLFMSKLKIGIIWAIIISIIGHLIYLLGIRRYEGFGG